MNGQFELRERFGFEFLSISAWEAAGVFHGFGGRQSCDRLAPGEGVAQALGLRLLCYLDQVHGCRCLDLREASRLSAFLEIAGRGLPYPPEYKSDAVLVGFEGRHDEKRHSAGRIGIALRTADCVPLIFISDSEAALIHAGWRGLSAGIIGHVLGMMGRRGGKLEAAIGPCAGVESYEVGGEVLEAIGNEAVYKREKSGRLFLSLRETAAAMIRRAVGPGSEIFDCGICTITTGGFHSFRRDGKRSGRNLSFLVL